MNNLIFEKTVSLEKKEKGSMFGKITIEISKVEDVKSLDFETLETLNSYYTLSIVGDTKNYSCQCQNNIKEDLEKFKSPKLLTEILNVWDRWHLNDLQAGTKTQTEYLNDLIKDGWTWSYDKACNELTKAELYEDRGYKYGTKWLVEQLHKEEIDKIIELFEKYENS